MAYVRKLASDPDLWVCFVRKIVVIPRKIRSNELFHDFSTGKFQQSSTVVNRSNLTGSILHPYSRLTTQYTIYINNIKKNIYSYDRVYTAE